MKINPLAIQTLIALTPLLATCLPIHPSSLAIRQDSANNYAPAGASPGHQPGDAGDSNPDLGEVSEDEEGNPPVDDTVGAAQPGNVTDGWDDATGRGWADMMASIWANPQFGSGGDGELRVRGLMGWVKRALVSG